MGEDPAVTICESCREPITDRAEDDIVFAFEQVDASTFRGTEYLDGLGAYFHRVCFPGLPWYRETDKPREG